MTKGYKSSHLIAFVGDGLWLGFIFVYFAFIACFSPPHPSFLGRQMGLSLCAFISLFILCLCDGRCLSGLVDI